MEFSELVEYYLWFIKDFCKSARLGKPFEVLNVRENLEMKNVNRCTCVGGNFVIYTDDSKDGLECILIKHDKVIVYASRKLKYYERK